MIRHPNRVALGCRCGRQRAVLFVAAAALISVAAPGQESIGLQFSELEAGPFPVDADSARAIAAVDVDGDGDRDLVVANSGISALYLNDGFGRFTKATAGRLPLASLSATDVAVGDVDGDGDADLVLAAGETWSANLLWVNDGSGTFHDATASQMPAVASATASVAFGDLDGDGDLDLVCGNLGDCPLVLCVGEQDRIYLNDGSGVFTDATAGRLPTLLSPTRSVALGDVDGDGDLDLAWGDSGSLAAPDRLYLNDGAGVFSDVSANRLPGFFGLTMSLALEDVDGDGDLDLALGMLGQQNRLYSNDGSGTFLDVTAAQLPIDSAMTRCVRFEDIEGDGDRDLVVANQGQNNVYTNDGSGSFVDATAVSLPSEGSDSRSIASGDFDGDGDADLVVANGSFTQDRLLVNGGSGVFTNVTTEAPGYLPTTIFDTRAIAIGDLNQDGHPDLLFGNTGQDQLFFNDGRANFTEVTFANLPFANDTTRAIALGDFDLDGDVDALFGTTSQDRLYLNDGNGVFTDVTASQLPADNDLTGSLAVGDVDADGDLDVLSTRHGIVRLYLNDGAGTFSDATLAQMPFGTGSTLAVALGDVDFDGDLDVVVGTTDQNRLYLNDGAGTFSDVSAARMPNDIGPTWSLALGDVDFDGDLDVICANVSVSQNRLYINDSFGVFTDETAARLPAANDTTYAMALVDVDGDFDLDLVFGDYNGRNRVLVNDSTGTYSEAVERMLPADRDASLSMAAGDLDKDGDVDLLWGNFGQRNRLYLNLLRHLDPRTFLRVGEAYALDAYMRNGPASVVDLAAVYLSTGPAAIPLAGVGTVGIDPVWPHRSRSRSFPRRLALRRSTGRSRTFRRWSGRRCMRRR